MVATLAGLVICALVVLVRVCRSNTAKSRTYSSVGVDDDGEDDGFG